MPPESGQRSAHLQPNSGGSPLDAPAASAWRVRATISSSRATTSRLAGDVLHDGDGALADETGDWEVSADRTPAPRGGSDDTGGEGRARCESAATDAVVSSDGAHDHSASAPASGTPGSVSHADARASTRTARDAAHGLEYGGVVRGQG